MVGSFTLSVIILSSSPKEHMHTKRSVYEHAWLVHVQYGAKAAGYDVLQYRHSMNMWTMSKNPRTRYESKTHDGLGESLYMIYFKFILRPIGVQGCRSPDGLENKIVSITWKPALIRDHMASMMKKWNDHQGMSIRCERTSYSFWAFESRACLAWSICSLQRCFCFFFEEDLAALLRISWEPRTARLFWVLLVLPMAAFKLAFDVLEQSRRRLRQYDSL